MSAAGSVTATLQVRNQVGMLATGTAPTRTITVTPPANQPPVATVGSPAGNVTVVQGGTVNFQGSGTDPNNNLPLTYNWNFGGGAPNSTAQNPGAVMFNTAGMFTVSFTVTDSLGLASTAVTRVVTVTSPANQPPVATIGAPAGNVTVVQGGTVNFQGSGADPNNNLPLTYNWNFGGGAPNSTAQNPGAVMFNTVGTFTVSFTVTDSLGLASTPVTRVITVTSPANQPPVATIGAPAGNVTVAQGGTVNFQGSGTDPNNNLPLTYNWNFGGGAANSTAQNPGAVIFNTAGTFTVSFTVTDSLGLASTAVTRVITVSSPANQPPVATIGSPAGNVTVAQGGTVNFQGSGTDPNNNLPLTYNWNFGGGAVNSTAQNPGMVTFNTVGMFTVTFTVTDSLGLASTPVIRVVTVTGVGQQPVAIIEEPNQNRTIARGRSIEFHGDADSDDEDDELRFNWSFPGGTPATSTRNEVKVFFNTAGTFTVTLAVTDSQGRTSAPVSRVITVTGAAANQPPVATMVSPADNVTVAQGGTVNFQGSGVDPDGNTPLTYNWNFGGGAPNSTAQNPGAVRFGTAGTFTVTFTVNDSLGLASTLVTRTVTVTPAGMPVADIVAPAMNVSVLPGGRVTFRGAASGSANLPLRFRWTFQGGSPQSSTRQNPSAVRFTEVGMHTVTLTVTDSKGQVSMPVTRVVTVAPPNASRIRLNDRCFGDNNNDDDDDDDDDD
jgi:PKD repeat protein